MQCRKSAKELENRRLLMYSYGSGMAASMFSIRCETSTDRAVTLDALCSSLASLPERLNSRDAVSTADYTAVMSLREETHHAAPYAPTSPLSSLWPGTFCITGIDEMHRRQYEVHAKDEAQKQLGSVPFTLLPTNGH